MQQLDKHIIVGSRDSKLSQIQVQEVLMEIQHYDPYVRFITHFVKTTGDIDQKTSLRTLGQTNFFTKEIDEMLLKGACRIGIHSAKDLPDPLPKGLSIVALTKGVDPSDSLVFRQGCTLESLPPFSIIATSSLRREGSVLELRKDLKFVDIRGTIDKRLQKLWDKEIDGVVIAEAAIVRLNLMHLNRITLPGATAHLQGRLAVLARSDDLEMKKLFQPLDYKSP